MCTGGARGQPSRIPQRGAATSPRAARIRRPLPLIVGGETGRIRGVSSTRALAAVLRIAGTRGTSVWRCSPAQGFGSGASPARVNAARERGAATLRAFKRRLGDNRRAGFNGGCSQRIAFGADMALGEGAAPAPAPAAAAFALATSGLQTY